MKKTTALLAFKMLLKLHLKAYSLDYWRIDQSQYIRGHSERKEIILRFRDVNYSFLFYFLSPWRQVCMFYLWKVVFHMKM